MPPGAPGALVGGSEGGGAPREDALHASIRKPRIRNPVIRGPCSEAELSEFRAVVILQGLVRWEG
eukprot:6896876-Alexandrium_andersonii.AAC.1